MSPLLLLLLACNGAPDTDVADAAGDDDDDITGDDDDDTPGDDDDDDTPGDDDTGETAGTIDTGPPDAGFILDAVEITGVGTGGWVVVDPVILPVTSATLGGEELEAQFANSLGAFVFDIPEDLEAGRHRLDIVGVTGTLSWRMVDLVDPVFADVSAEVGLVDTHDATGWEPGCAQALTGVAFADFDLDGDMDSVIGHYGPTTRLLRNDAAPGAMASFVDVVDPFPGLDSVASLAVADVDGDGDPDLWVGRRGTNRLYENRWLPDGTLTFTDVTDAWGIDVAEKRTMGAVFGDPDADGDLDLYEINHTWCFPGSGAIAEGHDTFYRNDGGTYVRIDDQLPNDDPVFPDPISDRMGFSGVWIDYDRDRDLDLMVINDFVIHGGPNMLLRNEEASSLTFTDQSNASGFALSPDPVFKQLNGMGIDVADLNGDGRPDVPVSNISPNILLISHVDPATGEVTYVNEGYTRGIQRTILPWGDRNVTWGTHLFDHDNDGDIDLFFVGGTVVGAAQVPHAFFDNQGDGTFVEITWEAGLESRKHGKATALVDFDHDGFLDLVVANWAGPLEVYRNHAGDRTGNHWLAVDLTSSHPNVHREAFGAIVELTRADGTVNTCFRTPRPSLAGASDTACRFGLGSDTTVGDVRVFWPDGGESVHSVSGIDQRITLVDPR